MATPHTASHQLPRSVQHQRDLAGGSHLRDGSRARGLRPQAPPPPRRSCRPGADQKPGAVHHLAAAAANGDIAEDLGSRVGQPTGVRAGREAFSLPMPEEHQAAASGVCMLVTKADCPPPNHTFRRASTCDDWRGRVLSREVKRKPH